MQEPAPETGQAGGDFDAKMEALEQAHQLGALTDEALVAGILSSLAMAGWPWNCECPNQNSSLMLGLLCAAAKKNAVDGLSGDQLHELSAAARSKTDAFFESMKETPIEAVRRRGARP